MYIRILITAAALSILAACAAPKPAAIQQPPSQVAASSDTFEYEIFTVQDAEIIARLNTDGALGWEVVTARRVEVSDPSRVQYEFIMKRTKRPLLTH
jgi:uncharacterized lipoprotein YajG